MPDMKMMVAAFIAVSVLSAARADGKASGHGAAHVSADPVVLENAYLKITVDRAGGGTARRIWWR